MTYAGRRQCVHALVLRHNTLSDSQQAEPFLIMKYEFVSGGRVMGSALSLELGAGGIWYLSEINSQATGSLFFSMVPFDNGDFSVTVTGP